MKKILALSLLTALSQAQPPSDPRIAPILAELASVHQFDQVAISPNGNRAAYIAADTIYIHDLAAKTAPTRIISPKPSSTRNLAWSPDSTTIAFLSDRDKKGQMQLYGVPSTGGHPRKLTSLTGFLTDPRWSPDGTHIALLFAENAPGRGGPLEAEPIETGVIGGEIHNQRLTIVDTTSGAAKQVSPADMNIYEYDWSPDSGSFALTAAPGPGDNNWWIAQLYTMSYTMSADTAKLKPIFRPETQIALPRWSPDGQSIAFIQGLMSDESFTGGDVFTIASSGGQAVNRTPDRKTSVSSLQWTGPSKLLLTEVVGGGSAISTLELPPAAPSACGKAARTSTTKATSRISPSPAPARPPQ